MCCPFGKTVLCQIDGCTHQFDISTLELVEALKIHCRRHYEANASAQKTKLTGFKLSDYLPGFVGPTEDYIIDAPTTRGGKKTKAGVTMASDLAFVMQA